MRTIVPMLLLFCTVPQANATDDTVWSCLRMLSNGATATEKHRQPCDEAGATAPAHVRQALRAIEQQVASRSIPPATREFAALPAELVAAQAGESYMLAYATIALGNDATSAEQMPEAADALALRANLILDNAAAHDLFARNELRPYLQQFLAALVTWHLGKKDIATAHDILQRLDHPSFAEHERFMAYQIAMQQYASSEAYNLRTTKEFAARLADTYGIDSWQTGSVIIAVSHAYGTRRMQQTGDRMQDALFSPFITTWQKADLLRKRPETAAWFIDLAMTRHLAGLDDKAEPIVDYLIQKARDVRLPAGEYRRLGELAIATKISLRKYGEARRLEQEFDAGWRARYAMIDNPAPVATKK